MICYDCTPDSVSNEAVGVCNYCSAGICRKHAVDLEKPITVLHIVDQVVTLPIPARTLFPSRLLKSAIWSGRTHFGEPQLWKAVIVDDEPRSRAIARRMLAAYPAFNLVAECANGYDALAAVSDFPLVTVRSA